MEPTKFDQLIRGKLDQANEIHANESSKSKAFVWSRILTNLSNNDSWKKILLAAAAVFIFLIGSTFIIYNKLKSQQYEVQLFSQKIEGISNKYDEQAVLLKNKDQKIDQLISELKAVRNEVQYEKRNYLEPSKTVYQTDTIIIREIEYIAQATEEIDSISINKGANIIVVDEQENKSSILEDNNNNIYPSFENTKQQVMPNEPIKIKLISFVSN